MLRIAIVDDHQILIDTLRFVLEFEPDMEIAGAANNLEEARELIKSTTPDIMLLEVLLPDGNGFELVSLLRKHCPQTRLIILTTAIDDITIMRALDYEVQGLLSKTCSLDELFSTLRKVGKGEISIGADLLMRMLKRQTRSRVILEDNRRSWICLTSREMEVLHCLVLGKSSDLIADELHITPLTVRTHIRNLMSKLGVHTRLEAVSFALTRGLVQAPRQ